MGTYDNFKFKPAPYLPHSALPLEELERIRHIKREDMEYTNENGFSVRVVPNPSEYMTLDMITRLIQSDKEDKQFVMICPNTYPSKYSAVADMVNKFNINLRNVHAFAMDEWADDEGNVCPHSFGPSLGYSFMHHFYDRIREDLRPDVSHWHTLNNDNVNGTYSNMIEDLGGADVIYSATGWPGHVAFIDPRTEEFKADSLEEFCKLKSRIVTSNVLTVCENSLFSCAGSSGDVWATPWKAATIGPYDVVTAKERVEVHQILNSPTGDTWQRMISRLELYGPISMECPASIMRLGKGTCYVSNIIARPFSPRKSGYDICDL